MNRLEELELTVQMLVDQIVSSTEEAIQSDGELVSKGQIAESILANQPCNCAELHFPHKRTRACFRRY